MKVAITSTVVLEIPDGYAQRYDTEALRRDFEASNRFGINKTWITTSGVPYRMLAIESFQMEVRRAEKN